LYWLLKLKVNQIIRK